MPWAETHRAWLLQLQRQEVKLKNFERTEIMVLQRHAGKQVEAFFGTRHQAGERGFTPNQWYAFLPGHGIAQQNQFLSDSRTTWVLRGERSRIDKAGLQTILAHSISDRELEKFFRRTGMRASPCW